MAPGLKQKTWVVVSLAFLMFATGVVALADGAPRPGKVEFSDGSTLAGNLSLTPGGALKLHIDNQIRTLNFDRVRELRMEPETESLEQGYRFLEAGKAFRTPEGKPYPVRALKTTIAMAGGESLVGHLYTTVLYVDNGENAKKIILLAKQRGKEGEALKDLVYTTRISFEQPGGDAGGAARLKLTLPEVSASSEVVALTLGTLDRIEAKAGAVAGEYTLPSASGGAMFVAVKHNSRVLVGWPTAKDEKTAALVKSAFTNSEDFFDERRIAGIYHDESSGLVYSLVLASRKGKTTLEEKRSQPWRLELYRWKLDDEGNRLMLAGKGYFFRGIDARNESVPAVELSPRLWKLKSREGVWTTE